MTAHDWSAPAVATVVTVAWYADLPALVADLLTHLEARHRRRRARR